MTTLPPDFVFNQGNLQDFMDCQRRFQLRHLLRIPWPAVESEPIGESENFRRRGLALHRLIHQHLLGFSGVRLLESARAQDLEELWQSFLQHRPAKLPQQRHPEIFLSAPIAGYQVLAKLDLLTLGPESSAVIVDWKTSRPQSQSWLANRMQTLVYRYLLARAGPKLGLGHVDPDSIEMVYWYLAEPENSIRFGYDQEQFERDEATLTEIIQEIDSLGEDRFALTEDRNRCAFCSYRSLCERGEQAGTQSDFDDDAIANGEFVFDWEQIAEVEF